MDKELYNQREDLKLCGRTLFGAKPPKGQELDDHYFGAIKPRVAAFMKDLDEELWKLASTPRPSTTRSPLPSTRWRPSSPMPTPPATTPAGHGDHEEGGRPPRPGVLLHVSPSPASTAPASTTTGPSPPTLARTSSPPARPPARTPSPAVPGAFIKGVDEYQELLRSTVAFAGTTTAWAPRSASGHHLHLPGR